MSDRPSTGTLVLLAGVALVIGGGYVFMHTERGGVNPVTLGSFGAILAGIILFVVGRSMAAAGEHEGMAGELGLEVKSAVGLPGSERVEMEGDFGGIKVHLSRRETDGRSGGGARRRSESYACTLTLPNPAKLEFYVGPDSILQNPLAFLPPELESARAWEWVDDMKVCGEPQTAAERLFGDRAAWALYRDFFGTVSCRLKGSEMEFEPEGASSGYWLSSDDGREFKQTDELKRLIRLAVQVAHRVAALPPAPLGE